MGLITAPVYLSVVVCARETRIKDRASMPTCTRLLLTLRDGPAEGDGPSVSYSEPDESDGSTHVFDTVSTRREVSTAAAARRALLSCGGQLPPALRDALAAQLAQAAAESAASGEERGNVPLAHGLQLEEARAWVPKSASSRGSLQCSSVLEGAATFEVCGQALRSRLRGLRVAAALDGQTLELVALVHSSSKPEAGRPALHFLGPSSGELKDVRALELGKRSNSQVNAGPASHFLRRGWQLQAHAAAMRDAYCAVDAATTTRAHTLLLDAYVSEVEHAGRALRCVSLFV
jgi:hypothetical protein